MKHSNLIHYKIQSPSHCPQALQNLSLDYSLASPPVLLPLTQFSPAILASLLFQRPSQSTPSSGFFHLLFTLPRMPCQPQPQGQVHPSLSSGLCSSVTREGFLHYLKNTVFLSLPIDLTLPYILHSTYHHLTCLYYLSHLKVQVPRERELHLFNSLLYPQHHYSWYSLELVLSKQLLNQPHKKRGRLEILILAFKM